MGKPQAAPIRCRKCGGDMRVARRVAHTMRPGCQRQTLECTRCEHCTLRTVTDAEPPARPGGINAARPLRVRA